MKLEIFKKKLINFTEISRLNSLRPIFFLFLPCLWGLFLAYRENISKIAIIKAFFIFLFGSISGRSIGCIFNDIVDRDIDKNVERTKNRLITSNKISISFAFFSIFIWLLVGLISFAFLNQMAKMFVICGMCLMIIYPFTKRFTYYPQLFLGFAFNIGIFCGFSIVFNTVTNSCLILYIIGIYWTLFYDTIYAMQDIEDDLKNGIKSTAVKYGNEVNIKLSKFVLMIYIGLSFVGILEKMSIYYYISFIPLTIAFLSIFPLIQKDNKANLKIAFNRNIYVGIIIAIQILIGKAL